MAARTALFSLPQPRRTPARAAITPDAAGGTPGGVTDTILMPGPRTQRKNPIKVMPEIASLMSGPYAAAFVKWQAVRRHAAQPLRAQPQGAFARSGKQERKTFFFKKKKQKIFAHCA
jgi:hypothetical protein